MLIVLSKLFAPDFRVENAAKPLKSKRLAPLCKCMEQSAKITGKKFPERANSKRLAPL
jgi:hypothetical protein